MHDKHPPLKCGERQRQTGIARTGVCHGCEEILLRRRRDGGRQRHIEADAEKCERVSVRLVMTRSWLRRAGEAAALALTHLIPTGPPGWRHSVCAVAFLCFNFFVCSSHTWAFLTSERLWKRTRFTALKTKQKKTLSIYTVDADANCVSRNVKESVEIFCSPAP